MSLLGRLTVDLDAVARNWRALDAMSAATTETAAVIKADAYGCGIGRVAPALAHAGARSFFVALPTEGAALRQALGPGPAIYVLAGYAPGHAGCFRDHDLRPVLNAPEQIAAWVDGANGPAALQFDTGMNRLGLEGDELAALRGGGYSFGEVSASGAPQARGGRLAIALVMSHLACADTPEHPMNAEQRRQFRSMTQAIGLPASLAATGGILLGADYHFDVTRPGVGLFAGMPFAEAAPVVRLEVPILQVRDLAPGEVVGYGATWRADRPTRIATLAAGYADGLIRAMGNQATAYVEGTACSVVGRVSMDLVTLDVTDCPVARSGVMVELLGPHQGIDKLADAAGTIGYEILTSLGRRYERCYRS